MESHRARHARLNEEEELLCCLLLLRQRRKRRWSTRPLNMNRQEEGDNSLVRPMRGIDEQVHFKYFRMSADRFDDLLQKVVVAEVRKYRHLYDSAHKAHRDQNIVKHSWREIAVTVGEDEHAVRKCWKNLRDRFVKARKGAKGKSGDPRGSKNTPTILKEMGWLSSFIKHRGTEKNVTSNVVAVEESQSDLLQPTTTPSPVPSPSSSRSSELSALQNTLSFISPVEKVCSSSPASSGEETSSSEGPSPAPKRRKMFERVDQERGSQKETEEVRFCYVVADLLAKISPRKKMAVQFKIYQLLYEAIQSDYSQ